MLRNGSIILSGRAIASAKPTRGMADWLCLAASPVFAAMALLTSTQSGPPMLCSMGMDSALIGGMAPMYLLMSLFHLPPWLKLIASGQRSDRPGQQKVQQT